MSNQETDISWAIKLLEPEPDLEPNIISKYYHQLVCGTMGVATPVLGNYLYNRPLWAGIQRHFLFGAAGFLIGVYLNRRETDILAIRDAKLRHYITLHPEDFPPPQRRKFAEIFMEWLPLR